MSTIFKASPRAKRPRAAVSVQVKGYKDWLAADFRLRKVAGKLELKLERKRTERWQTAQTYL